jgi:hypothetical protein
MPEDKKPKIAPKQPVTKKPESSTLRQLFSAATGLLPTIAKINNPIMAGKSAISRVALNRMAENLDPFDYRTMGRSTVDRAYHSIIKNEKEPSRAETEQYIDKGYGAVPNPTFKERVDLLQMLAGKKQKYNTIEPSEHRPTIGAEKSSKYYRSKGIEQEIIKNLGLNDKSVKWQKDILDMITAGALLDEDGKKMIRKSGVVNIVPGLGAATYGVGKDKKGVYLSYSDTWDLDPSSGAYADKKAKGLTTMENLNDAATGFLKDVSTNVINTEATPPKVYGRIYFDPKTGKPIQ